MGSRYPGRVECPICSSLTDILDDDSTDDSRCVSILLSHHCNHIIHCVRGGLKTTEVMSDGEPHLYSISLKSFPSD
jgi:hypothetical protein